MKVNGRITSAGCLGYWLEIPAAGISRAQKFYEAIFDVRMIPMDTPNFQMRMFPVEGSMSICGALVFNDQFYKSSDSYGPLNGNPDVQIILDRIEAAGGKVLVPKTQITLEYGHMAVFLDTAGDKILLHSVTAGM